MKIYKHNVSEIPIVFIVAWSLLVIATSIGFGIEGFIVGIVFGAMMFLPMIILGFYCFGFIEKINEKNPNQRGQD